MDKFNEDLNQLIQDTCQQPRGSFKRQRGMTEIVKRIQRKLWKESSPYYGDALQRTWLYFCRNLCEATTGEKFDSEQSSVITWLNGYLKFELKKFWGRKQKELEIIEPPTFSNTGDVIDPLEFVPAPVHVPSMLESTTEWVETDPTGELRCIHVKGHPEITCQAVILRRLPPEMPWKKIAEEFNVPLATLSTFYQRKCLPCLQKFGESQGYL
ncbi:MAG: sigma-70 family RNA polymerase sigma factor [Scytonematopsis contorta HA4267-MV1]|nr:sigma-70 family RNA polymerase sigma factor [Scytonematopsis contorta HA4267-MV1]